MTTTTNDHAQPTTPPPAPRGIWRLLVAVFAVLAATGPWIGSTMIRFAAKCLGGFLEVMH